MGSQKLHVILGRKASAAVFRQRKAHITDKESSLSFRFVALRVLGLLERRPQNDLDNESNIIFASSFVWRNTKTRFALCKSFRPAFFKRLAPRERVLLQTNSSTNQNLKNKKKTG
jgi:hypothetical protein